ncbi:hypothetical protein, partial [Flavobacterium sp.]|uniref:hypothetical protein n=1 Tax=Flavobacterium sp. TaxID=239 RepID=UPI00286E84E8
RVVKPACADGTAVMWESMSSPFFNLNLFQILKSSSFIWWGFFLFIFFKKNKVKFSPNRVVKPVCADGFCLCTQFVAL